MASSPRRASIGLHLRMRSAAAGLGLVIGLTIGLTLGCLGELPRGRSCGDGWWDPEYEQCDPSSEDRSYVDACRAQGWARDATCNPDTCEIEASEQQCQQCGDGVASGTEECDGNDVRGATCPSGSGVVRCTDKCTLDFDLCPAVCGDGIVNGTEECEPSLACGSDEDCGEGRACYELLSECVPSEGFGPNLACSYYTTTALGIAAKIDKPYASGNISQCTDDCFFGRNRCGFCGDGVLDGMYSDFVFPGGEVVTFPGEFCDGNQAAPSDIEAHCKPLCVNEPINGDVVVLCDIECNDKCTGFAPPDDIAPSPESLGCCLAAGSPCPNFDKPGVPDLPCCAWLEKPEWLEQAKCVPKDTDALPITYVCPG